MAARVEQLETREETRGEETREETNEEEARLPGDKLVRVLGPQPMEVGHPLEAQEDHQQLEVYSSEAQPLAREALLPAVAEAPRDQPQVLRLPMLYLTSPSLAPWLVDSSPQMLGTVPRAVDSVDPALQLVASAAMPGIPGTLTTSWWLTS